MWLLISKVNLERSAGQRLLTLHVCCCYCLHLCLPLAWVYCHLLSLLLLLWSSYCLYSVLPELHLFVILFASLFFLMMSRSMRNSRDGMLPGKSSICTSLAPSVALPEVFVASSSLGQNFEGQAMSCRWTSLPLSSRHYP